jgi:hypothetical protein
MESHMTFEETLEAREAHAEFLRSKMHSVKKVL